MRSSTKSIALAVLMVTVLIVSACGAAAPTAAPTEAPTPTEAPSTSLPVLDDLWPAIQKNGSMTVGLSADYPPFEFYDSKFKLDGFDVALMKAIGEKIGITIEFNDFAFDGLGNALVLGQIDSAISAISVTPERQQLVDFSNVYYVGEDAVLVGANSDVSTIKNADELSTLRIGVQGLSLIHI